MTDTPLRIAVDLDGVIHDPTNKLPGYKMGQPVQGAVGALTMLKAQGALIVIHTVWGDTDAKREAISKWCQFFKIPYDVITNVKPTCDVYIDDHGYRFENWDETLIFLSKIN